MFALQRASAGITGLATRRTVDASAPLESRGISATSASSNATSCRPARRSAHVSEDPQQSCNVALVAKQPPNLRCMKFQILKEAAKFP